MDDASEALYDGLEWTRRQDKAFPFNLQLPKMRLSRALPLHRRKPYKPFQEMYSVQQSLSRHVRFKEWKEFHGLARSAAAADGAAQVMLDLQREHPKQFKYQVEARLGAAFGNLTSDIDLSAENDVHTLSFCSLHAITTLCSYVKGKSDAKSSLIGAVQKRNLRRKVGAQEVPFPRDAVPDFSILRKHGGSIDEYPIVAVDIHRPGRTLYYGDKKPCSAAEQAKNFEDSFCTPDFSSSGHLNNRWFHIVVALALECGLHGSTGYCALWTHNGAVFMKIDVNRVNRRELSHRDWLSVSVSRIYSCDETVSSLHGLFAILCKAMEDDGSSRAELDQCLLDIRRDECVFYPPYAAHARSNTDGATPSDAPSIESVKESAVTRVNAAVLVSSDETIPNAHVEGLRLIRRALHQHQGILGSGGSGIVLSANVEGKAVAVKYWNGHSRLGKEWLMNEIRVLQMFTRNYPKLVGVFVPRLVAMNSRLESDPVLVTEIVGQQVEQRYLDDGMQRVVVGGNVVSLDEETELLCAGMECLQAVHAAGVAHMDVKPANLRAARTVLSDGRVRWRVWLLDFGLAEMNATQHMFAEDQAYIRDSLLSTSK